MRRKILYNILNEWRDDDMDDSSIDLDDDMNIEHGSSDMSDEPDLDDEFALSTTQETSYEYFPETKEELKKIIRMEIEKQGGVNVNLNMIDTSRITNMSVMFNRYTSLQTLDVSGWDVSNVKNMNYMFCGCVSLHTIDVSGWDVSNVNNMCDMFYGCKSLRTIDVSGWDVSNVNNMYDMFYKCTSLETLDVSGWDVSNVKDMSSMFSDCESLETLDVSGWDVSNVKYMDDMFNGCTLLDTDTTMWNIITNNVNDMYYNAPRIKHN